MNLTKLRDLLTNSSLCVLLFPGFITHFARTSCFLKGFFKNNVDGANAAREWTSCCVTNPTSGRG